MTARCFLLLLQIVVIAGLTYNSLRLGVILRQGDELISTLGNCKLVLIQKDCTLNLYQFNPTSLSYQSKNKKYNGINNGSCKSLTISNQNVVTDTNTTFLALNSTDLTQVRLIVDDLANLRLIGVKRNPFETATNAYYQQQKLGDNSQPNQFVIILQQFQKISDRLINQTITNKNWTFNVLQNQLTIKHKQKSINKTFSLPDALFSQSGIWDASNETLPYAIFQGMKYSTVCGQKKNELIGPFIISVDEFWPVLRIYDQDGYILFEYSFTVNQQFYGPCPKGTFAFQADCLLQCPNSYFKFIENDRGSCKLNCEQGSIYNQTQKSCSCKNRQISARQQYFCVNSSKYHFGCYCQNNLFFDKSTWKCVQNCTQGTLAYKGLCLSCGNRCSNCSIQSGSPFFLVCNNCTSGYVLNNGICIESNANCSPNCLVCLGNTCSACLPFYSLVNNTCIQQCPTSTSLSVLSNLSSVCSNPNSPRNCPPSCQVCDSNIQPRCMVCKPQYILLVSPLISSCQRKNLLFSCSSSNYLNFKDLVCYYNEPDTFGKCTSSIQNCYLCVYQTIDKCLACKDGYLLQDNKCVSSCSDGYYNLNQACVPALSQCKVHGFVSHELNSSLDLTIVSKNQIYNFLTSNGKQQINQPYGYQLFATKSYQLTDNNYPISSLIRSSEVACVQCSNGYGLSKDRKSCLPCPTGCLLCLYAQEQSCIASSVADQTQYNSGINIKDCQSFLNTNLSCISSCPENTLPSISSTYKQLVCQIVEKVENYLKIDGTSIQISADKYLHRFIFSSPLSQIPALKGRLLQGVGTFDKSRNSFTVNSTKPYYVLNLTGTLTTYKSVDNSYPVNSIYGINAQTSYSSYIKRSLAYVGYILSLMILFTHCVYVGNGLTCKMDNIIIFAQSIFYFLFTDVFISNPISQYYYGWSWMHLNFYPNYFWSLLSADEQTIPPYALNNVDANFIRNAGGSISLLMTFGFTWLVVSGVCYFIEVRLGKWQIWYQRICKNSLLSMIELCSYNIIYWAVAYFRYDFNSDSKSDTKQSYTGFPVMFIIAIVGYTLIRLYLDILGPMWKRSNYYNDSAIYMIKRIVYASVIACSYQNKVYLVIILMFQLAFLAVRYFLLEQPANNKQKMVMVIEQIGIVFGMITLYLVKTAFVVAFLITIIVYLWYLTFVIDLVDLYLISKNYVLQSSWLPCLQERTAINSRENSKEDVHQQKTDRPFNSQVQK